MRCITNYTTRKLVTYTTNLLSRLLDKGSDAELVACTGKQKIYAECWGHYFLKSGNLCDRG